MIDVIGGLKVVAASAGVTKAAGPLVNNIFDPITKEMGEDLRNWYVEKRRRNIIRVAESAQRKLVDPNEKQGSLSLKVFQEILDGGSVAEDELASEYFGGVLASSLSGIDRDDRGAAFAKLVSQLSVYQLRTHYLIYSQVKKRFDGNACQLGTRDGRDRLRIFISEAAYESALELAEQEPLDDILTHSLDGLRQRELIDIYVYGGDQEIMKMCMEDPPSGGIVVAPSGLGAELFLWAHGWGQVSTTKLLDPQLRLESSVQLPIDGLIIPLGEGDLQMPGRSKG